MAKKVLTQIKLQAVGGQASPAPPVGPALGQHGINIMEFVKAFFAQTRSDIRLQILEGRKQRMTEQADGMRSSLARTRERMDRYTLQLQEHGLESADREVRWLTELIETERRGPN